MVKPQISVEIEPPHGTYTSLEERNKSIQSQIIDYADLIQMLSITNRPVFGLSAITMAKRVQSIIRKKYHTDTRVSVHLTTRLSHFDLFRAVLDAHRMELSDLLPILGDPRGPDDPHYFTNGFEILGFVSYLKTGDQKYLSDKYLHLLNNGSLVEPIKEAKFKIGSVIDLNPTRITKNNEQIMIRKRQIRSASKKERYGAEYLMTQGIFDAQHYFDFIDECDLKIPIIPGVMPARLRLIEAFGIPINTLHKSKLRAQFTTSEEKGVGNKIAQTTFNELLDGGCKQIHVYSLGNSKNFFEITGLSKEESASDQINFQGVQKKGELSSTEHELK